MVPSPSDSRHGNTVSMPPASRSSGRILTNGDSLVHAGGAGQIDRLALEARGPARRPQHGLLAVGGRDHRLPRVLDQAAGMNATSVPRPNAPRPMPSDRPISLRRLIVEPSSASVRLAATVLRWISAERAVVAVLDRDLFGDELLLEQHRADADRQDRQPERQAVQRGGQVVPEAALASPSACTPTARTGRSAAAPARKRRPAEANTPPRARRASRPWCRRPASAAP